MGGEGIFGLELKEPKKRNMKKLFTLALATMLYGGMQAQLTGFSMEMIADHTNSSIPELVGKKTYRLYADMTNPGDKLSAVFGDATSPLSITSSTGFYNSTLGGNFAQNVNPLFFTLAPQVQYDSWLTIGFAPEDGAPGDVSNIGLNNALNAFNSGGNLVLDDTFGGSWFVLITDPYSAAGADLKVLVAQLTTSGVISGVLNAQVFINGNQSTSQEAEGIAFSSDPGAIFGCTNPAATNYNPAATTDDGSCSLPCALTLTQGNVSSITCPGLQNGSIQVTQTGAQGGALFGINGNTPTQAFGNFNNLAAGTYTVAAVDGAGCTSSIQVTVTAPSAIQVSATLTSPITCNNSNNAVISGQATGGTGAFVYSLASNFSNPSSTLNFTSLGAGSYNVYARDANNCTANSPLIVVNNPAPLNVFITNSAPASCFNTPSGQIVVTTTGGTPGSTGMQFSTTASNYAPGNVLFVLPGVYTVYAIDVNGCTGQSAAQATITSPPAINLVLTTENISCNGLEDGSISFQAAGGSGNLNYTWNGASGMAGTVYGDLGAGNYAVTVTDNNNCTVSQSAVITEPLPIIASASAQAITCNGAADGVVNATAAGGSGGFLFSIDGVNYQASPVFGGLDAGGVTIYVEDENGCSITTSATVTEPNALNVTGTVVNDSGTGNGSVNITVTGGTGAYGYAWSGPNGFSSDVADPTGLVGGSYTVVVTDANGCSTEWTTEVLVGVAEFVAEWSTRVYPNPSQGIFQVVLEGLQGERVALEVVDAQGRMVWNEQLGQRAGTLQTTMDLQGLSSGLYHLIITADNIRQHAQLLKQD
jgi:hypothetical protein